MSIADGELTSLAFCWRLERRDGAGLAMTSHDAPIVNGGITYDPEPGMTPSATVRSLGLDPDGGEAIGAITASALTEQDLATGRWGGAAAELVALDWERTESPTIRMMSGELGEMSVEGERFSAEILGPASKLNGAVCPATSPECRAHFGDKACRVDLAGRTIRVTVAGQDGASLTADAAVGDAYRYGRLRYLDGANAGLTSVVLSVEGTNIRLRDVPGSAVAPGTRIELREGCDKTIETCATRFANAVNFRGEPHLPGNDLLTRYPGA